MVDRGQGRILVENGNSGGGGNKFRGGAAGLAHDHHGKLGMGQSQRRNVLTYACNVHMYQCIFAFITISTKFLSKYCIKRELAQR